MTDLQPITFPEGNVTPQWIDSFTQQLIKASWRGQAALPQLLQPETVIAILDSVHRLLIERPALVQVSPALDATVTVVGDTHGQLHDVVNLFKKAGVPAEKSHFIFNGDFVDRGSWGLEVLLLLGAWQLALPEAVTLLRGNHESATCTAAYGFQGELIAKYGASAQQVYMAAERVFCALPLAAHVAGATLVLHGGLFRAPLQLGRAPARKRRKMARGPLTVGKLEDLAGAFKGGPDPSGRGKTVIAADATWSDPVLEPGIHINTVRGVGLVFGPDITQAFLEENGLQLIIRSHEGPDARYQNEDPATNISQGYSIDHITTSGRLVTVFSAPDYPQHQVCDEERYRNLAAVAILRAPTFADPEFLQFEADLPRPAATCFYALDIPGSDDEIEIAGGGSDASSADGCSEVSAEPDGAAAMEVDSSQAAAAAAVDPPQTSTAAPGAPPPASEPALRTSHVPRRSTRSQNRTPPPQPAGPPAPIPHMPPASAPAPAAHPCPLAVGPGAAEAPPAAGAGSREQSRGAPSAAGDAPRENGVAPHPEPGPAEPAGAVQQAPGGSTSCQPAPSSGEAAGKPLASHPLKDLEQHWASPKASPREALIPSVHADPGIVRAPLADVASAAIVKEGKDAVANGGTQI